MQVGREGCALLGRVDRIHVTRSGVFQAPPSRANGVVTATCQTAAGADSSVRFWQHLLLLTKVPWCGTPAAQKDGGSAELQVAGLDSWVGPVAGHFVEQPSACDPDCKLSTGHRESMSRDGANLQSKVKIGDNLLGGNGQIVLGSHQGLWWELSMSPRRFRLEVPTERVLHRVRPAQSAVGCW